VSCVLSSPDPRLAFPGAPAFPPGVAFFRRGRGGSLSPAARRVWRDQAGGSGQRLWMSIAGSSWGDA
jgi:hypothetical protein